MYAWVAGKHHLGEPWLKTAKAAAWHNVHQSALGMVFALAMAVIVWLHKVMQVGFLEQWQALGADTRVQHNSIGPPAMFSGTYVWIWVVFYTLSGLTSYAAMYFWVGVVTRFRHTKTMIGWMVGWAVGYPLYIALFYFLANALDLSISYLMLVGPCFCVAVGTVMSVGASFRHTMKFPR